MHQPHNYANQPHDYIVTGIGNALAALTPSSKIYSQDLTGPNGPAAFYFPCTDQKP
jgi:hypothetical protein